MKKCLLLSGKLCRVSFNAWVTEGVNRGSVHCCWGQALCETGPWELMAKLMHKDLKEKDSSKAMRCCVQAWEKLHIAQAHAHPQPWRKINYIIYNFPLEEGAWIYTAGPRISPLLHTHTLWSAMPQSESLQSRLDRCDSFQHLSTQLLNPYLTSGINMHWHLGQTYITHYFIKNRTKFCVKELLCKGEQKSPSKEQFVEVKHAISIHQCDPGKDCSRASLWSSLFIIHQRIVPI